MTAYAAEPDVVPGNESAEPEVTIIQRGGEAIEEYRIANQLYMIKVTPAQGAPYYLVDTDGDGNLETRERDLDSAVVPPRWVLFRWR
ncbi:MAG: DUF2782 domain-containing protein [Pseudomonadota bacterium]